MSKGNINNDNDVIISRLAKRHETWKYAPVEERVSLAQQVLFQLTKKHEEWISVNNWVQKQANLVKLDHFNSETTQDKIIATDRFVFANIIRTWLETFIKTSNAKTLSFTTKPPRMVSIEDNNSHDKNNNNTASYQVYGPEPLNLMNQDAKVEIYCSNGKETGTKQQHQQKKENSSKEDSTVSATTGSVSLVLGAGNQPHLAMIDVLDRCFLHYECVLLKHHPLRSYLMDPFSIILKPLIEENIISMVLDTGNIPDTVALIQQEKVHHVHLTGSKQTFDSIRKSVQESGKEGICNVTGELGCSTPVIITPGKWTTIELKHAIQMFVELKALSGGANCLNPQVIVVPSGWEQLDIFMKELEDMIASTTVWPVYYPGAKERKQKFIEHYSSIKDGNRVKIFSSKKENDTKNNKKDEGGPYENSIVLIDCGTYGQADYDNMCLSNEAFCPILAVVKLPGGNGIADAEIDSYLSTACDFANSKEVFGSLSCMLLAPESISKPIVEKAATKLNFGAVCINCITVFGYFASLVGGIWGAHPSDVEMNSGIGYIGNQYKLPNVVKNVIYGSPLKIPRPPMDPNLSPPAIVFDCLHVGLNGSDSMVSAIWHIYVLLFIRTIQFMLNLVGIQIKKRYGSASWK